MIEDIRKAAFPVDDVFDRVGDARFVLIGESTHGTAEFYRVRAQLTRRLVEEKGFAAIACEADWPDAYRVNRFVRYAGTDHDAAAALGDFARFPRWMWRNREVLAAVQWLRAHDAKADRRVGFYGLDLYSLHASIGSVIEYLAARDPQAAAEARRYYGCFDVSRGDPHRYGLLGIDCEEEATEQLLALQRKRADLVAADGLLAEDEALSAEQNARVVVEAAAYYRALYRGAESTWNLRDTHMMDTLDAIAKHLGPDAKVVVWAHNSHCGDSAATQRDLRGEITLGHLCRARHPGATLLIGFSTYRGTVTAASDWDGPAEKKRVRPGLAGGYEALFHQTDLPRFALVPADVAALSEPRLQRAIGVVYRPDTERQSHYFHADLAAELDVVIHIDETTALEPLDRSSGWERGEVPETYPSGL